MTLAVAGLLYGLTGVLRLDVALDWGLLLAVATLVVAMARDSGAPRRHLTHGRGSVVALK